jgi:hypothetical protein
MFVHLNPETRHPPSAIGYLLLSIGYFPQPCNDATLPVRPKLPSEGG